MQREIRRCQDHLISIRTGVSAFGIWTVIRFIMTVVMQRKTLISEIVEQPGIISSRAALIGLCVFAAVFSLIILGIHLYIGLSARAEGLGGRKRSGYLTATGIFILFYVVGIITEVVRFWSTFKTITDGAVTIFIDTTMLVTLAELMFNAVRVRKLSRQAAEEG